VPRLVEATALDDLAPSRFDEARRPRQGLVAERETAPGVFSATAGPVLGYRRLLNKIDSNPDGTVSVRQQVRYELSVPLIGWLMAGPARRRLTRIGGDTKPPWWAPPATLDSAAWSALGAIVALAVVMGYLSTLITQTLTFSSQEFHASRTAQAGAFAVVRADMVLAFALTALADRVGRRTVALRAAAAGCLLTTLGAGAPSLGWLAASQLVARGAVTAVTILLAVLAAEVMPSRGRAMALALIAAASGIGAGLCVAALPLAGTGRGGWRALYAAGLLGLPLVAAAARHLEESARFRTHHEVALTHPERVARTPLSRSRLVLLAGAALLYQVFVTPATMFLNDYLRRERHFSASRLSLFALITVTPGVIGLLLGGRLADARGRRMIAVAGLLTSAVTVSWVYGHSGWTMWVAAACGYAVGTAVIPALGVYGPELFGTGLRGTANGMITGIGRVGGIAGLLAAGAVADAGGHFSPAIVGLALGPTALAGLVLLAFPETAGRELEELNPEDV